MVAQQEKTAEEAQFKKKEAEAHLLEKMGVEQGLSSAEIAEREADNRKHTAIHKMNNVMETIDTGLETSNLLEQLKGRDEALGLAIEEQAAIQREKLEKRKALIRERRRIKHQSDQEASRI